MQALRRFLALSVVMVFACLPVYAQGDFSLDFEVGHIIGTGNSIIVHRVPATNRATGESVLKNVTVDYGVAEDGSVVVETLTSEDAIPLPNSASNIIPGTYELSNGDRFLVSVGGTTADGRISGSMRSLTDTSVRLNSLFNATWVTGPVAGHPLIGNREIATELLDGLTYGIVGESRLFPYAESWSGCSDKIRIHGPSRYAKPRNPRLIRKLYNRPPCGPERE